MLRKVVLPDPDGPTLSQIAASGDHHRGHALYEIRRSLAHGRKTMRARRGSFGDANFVQRCDGALGDALGF